MIYTEVEKKELDEVQRVFAEHLRQCPDYELLWSDTGNPEYIQIDSVFEQMDTLRASGSKGR